AITAGRTARAWSELQSQSQTRAPEVQLLTAEQENVDILERVEMTQVAPHADVRRGIDGEAAANVIPQGAVLDAERIQGHMGPDETESADHIRLEDRSGNTNHDIAHGRKDRVIGIGCIPEEVLGVADVFLESNHAGGAQRHAVVRARLVAIGER